MNEMQMLPSRCQQSSSEGPDNYTPTLMKASRVKIPPASPPLQVDIELTFPIHHVPPKMFSPSWLMVPASPQNQVIFEPCISFPSTPTPTAKSC